MPVIEPKYLRPVVGYMMYQLRKGKSPSDALALAQSQKRFAGIPLDEMGRALTRAESNQAALARMAVIGTRLEKDRDGNWQWV